MPAKAQPEAKKAQQIDIRELWRKDLPTFAQQQLKIQDINGRSVAFIFYPWQMVLWSWLLEDLQSGKPIRWLILKARQLGVSTWIAAVLYWLTSLNKYKTALIVTHEEKPALDKLLAKQRFFYYSQEERIRPEIRLSNRRELNFSSPSGLGLESAIIGAVADDGNIGRSLTLNYVHLSEGAFYPALLELLSTLGSAVHDLAGTAIFNESTANAENDYKTLWDDKQNGYRHIFLPPVVSDEYRVELPEDYVLEVSCDPESRYGDEAALASIIIEECKSWRPRLAGAELEHYLAEVLVWRRQQIDQRFFGNKIKFAQEFPFTETEAFALSGDTVFPSDILDGFAQRFRNETRFGYTVKPNVDRGPSYADVKSFDRIFTHSTKQDLIVYEPPIAGESYVIGADSSYGYNESREGSVRGRGADRASASVLKETPQGLVEVALWNRSIAPSTFAAIIATLGYWYNTAFIVPEFNPPGNSTVDTLENLRYPRIYWRERLDLPTGKQMKVHGWLTGPTTKPYMINKTEEALRMGQLTLTLPPSILEMKQYLRVEETSAKTGKKTTIFKPVSGAQDNCVMAVCLAVMGAQDVKKPSISKQQTIREMERVHGTAPFWEKIHRDGQRNRQRRAW